MNYQNAEFVTSYFDTDKLPHEGVPEIAFAGRSNVGKSSLMNKLFGKKSLVRTSSTPGKTASINYFKAGGLFFVDLPGYGYAKVSKEKQYNWGSLIDGYFESKTVTLCILLLDIRHDPNADDLQMIEYLDSTEIPYFVVLTKCDKLNKTETQERYAYFEELLPDTKKIMFSSLKGIGVEELRREIDGYFKS